jgi:hypothetical protein
LVCDSDHTIDREAAVLGLKWVAVEPVDAESGAMEQRQLRVELSLPRFARGLVGSSGTGRFAFLPRSNIDDRLLASIALLLVTRRVRG